MSATINPRKTAKVRSPAKKQRLIQTALTTFLCSVTSDMTSTPGAFTIAAYDLNIDVLIGSPVDAL